MREAPRKKFFLKETFRFLLISNTSIYAFSVTDFFRPKSTKYILGTNSISQSETANESNFLLSRVLVVTLNSRP